MSLSGTKGAQLVRRHPYCSRLPRAVKQKTVSPLLVVAGDDQLALSARHRVTQCDTRHCVIRLSAGCRAEGERYVEHILTGSARSGRAAKRTSTRTAGERAAGPNVQRVDS
jgi:hypothetical protein